MESGCSMTYRQIALVLVLSFLAVLLGDFFFLHYLFPIKREALRRRANLQVQESLLEHPPEDPTQPQGLQQAFSQTRVTDFKTAAETCLGPGPWSDYRQLPENLEKTIGLQNKTLDIENFDLKLPNGEKRRVHLTGDPSGKRSLRYFSILKNGELAPIPLSPDLRSLPAENQLQILMKEGATELHLVKQRWLLKSGATVLLTFENDEPREIQIFGSSKTLTCLQNSCQCF
jgi:hypothetical protein